MTATQYFAFMEAISELAENTNAAVMLSSTEGIEQFSPPIFAAYCAHNGRACIERLARYKRLIGPMEFTVTEVDGLLSVTMSCPDEQAKMPGFLVQCEFAFLVNLIRTATKEQISPLSACMINPPTEEDFSAFLGCAIAAGDANILTFCAADMDISFISNNDAMWSYFEPELKRRLSELEIDDNFSARVRSVLIEMLPAGMCSADDAAHRLGISKRTLQRKLNEEHTTFQKQLNHTRELLAKHYLTTTAMRTDEIAYLLGYLELNSFLRAFSSWTGASPSEYRKSMVATTMAATK